MSSCFKCGKRLYVFTYMCLVVCIFVRICIFICVLRTVSPGYAIYLWLCTSEALETYELCYGEAMTVSLTKLVRNSVCKCGAPAARGVTVAAPSVSATVVTVPVGLFTFLAL